MSDVQSESSTPTDSVPLAMPPGAWRPIAELARLAKDRLDHFLRIQAASGVVLLIAAALAFGWANSPWAESYAALWQTPIGFHVGLVRFEKSLGWLVNDVLMVIFFFVVAMEIRGEVHDGELSDWRRAALPIVAAVGGMIAPAGFYLLLAGAPPTHSGWGVPMATDIAFAVGVLALLGTRVPPALRALLLALAVIDDLGAILVIALFYSSGVSFTGLLVAALGVGLIFILRAMGLRQFSAYIVPAAIVWLGVYSAGIHPTIAGVIVGLLTPVRAWLGPEGFVNLARDQVQQVADELSTQASHRGIHGPLRKVGLARREAVSPAEFLIEALHPWVAFLIMPVFAFANAGVSLHGIALTGIAGRAGLAVALALVLGKPLGIVALSLLAIRLRLSVLPSGLDARHLVVLGTVAGIGFTMSLFIAQLAFSETSLLAAARLGVLGASGVAMLVGLIVGRAVLPLPGAKERAQTSPDRTVADQRV
jgi:NhaA family Na+:H+ antiporter